MTTAPITGHLGRARARVLRTLRRPTTIVTSVVLVALGAAGVTAASWVGNTSVAVPSITAGSVGSSVAGFSGLTYTYSTSSRVTTAYVTVTNTGTVPASYNAAITLADSSSSSLAAAISVQAWGVGSAADCTATATPGVGTSGTWGTLPAFTGTLTAGEPLKVCLRTQVAASALGTTASVTPVLTATMSVPGTSWTSTGSGTATQNVVAQPQPALPAGRYAAAVAADGAKNYYPLNEASGTTVRDVVGFDDMVGSAGIVRGTPGAVAGSTDTASTFSGASSTFAATQVASTAPNSFALEAWFQTTSTTGGRILGFGNKNTGNSDKYDRMVYLDGAGVVSFGVYPGSTQTIASGAGYNDGAWHYVAANLSPAGMQLYVDGNLVGTRTDVTSGESNSGYWRIGGDSTWAGANYFTGPIDEVAIYSAPLSAATVQSHFDLSGHGQSTCATTDPYGRAVTGDSPTIYWRLAETGGTTACDSSGHGNTGLYYGNVTQWANGAVIGTRNRAATFGGKTGGVASTTTFANPQTYSIELWFSSTSTSGGSLINSGGSQTASSSTYDRMIYLRNDGTLRYGTYTGSERAIATTTAYNDGKWHHVVGTLSSAGLSFYVDGALIGTDTTTTSAEGGNRYWKVGGDNIWSGASSKYVAATIDEVAVYGSALTADQVSKHYATGTGQPFASFTSTISGVNATFDASASRDFDGSIASYAWDFGDGTTGTGPTATKTYTSLGAKTVKLTVTDDTGHASTTTRIVTATDNVVPSAPGTLTATAPTTMSGNKTKLSWTASTDNFGVTAYDIYRNNTLLTSVAGTVTTYVDATLASSTTYTYKVLARDAAGNASIFSSTVSVTNPDTIAPNAPGSLSASDTTATSTKLTWTASTDAIGVTGYDVYRNGAFVISTSTTSYTDNALAANSSYNYTVRAHDAAGNQSPDSGAITVATADTQAPTAPSSLAATNITDTSLTLTWSASTDNRGVVGYDVYQGTTMLGTTTALNYNATGLWPLSDYTFTVKARDAAGNVGTSPTLAVSTMVVNPAKWYQIKTFAGLCVHSAGTGDGAGIDQIGCVPANTDQNWQFTSTTSPYARITVRAATNSVLDVADVSTQVGHAVHLWSWANGANQMWQPKFTTSSGGMSWFQLVSKNSGLCLDAAGSSTASGATYVQNTCSTSTTQQFAFVEVP